jgi:hypothetical protein
MVGCRWRSWSRYWVQVVSSIIGVHKNVARKEAAEAIGQ